MKEVSNGKKQIDEQKVEKVEKIKNEKVEKKNISKEDIKSMISTFCDVDGRLKKFSDCLADEYPKEYLAYQPNDDEFLKKDLEDKVCEQIAEFILKTIVNK